jgi:Domain of unknown function (DUF4160)
MPELSRFYGLRIFMFFGDHAPPHFHVYYGKQEAVFDITSIHIIDGELPNRAVKLVREWANEHQVELHEAWNRCVNFEHPGKIQPLN